MKCPVCNFADTKVLESRLCLDARSIRRRRQCGECNYRFTTYEKEEAVVFQIRKRDGRIEAYVRDKALRSLQIACRKRDITLEQLEIMLDRIERAIQEVGDRTIPSARLGDMMLSALNDVDKVAYVRFASVYKDFKDPEEFMSELKSLT